jgi:hypothetical protein
VEESGGAEQQVAVQRAELGAGGLDLAQVVLAAGELVEHHPAVDPAIDRRRPVAAEVDAEAAAQQEEQPGAGIVVEPLLAPGGDVGMARQPDQLLGDLLGIEHEVGDAGVARGAQHAGVARGRRILDERDPVGFLDRLQPERPVVAAARQDHADRAVAEVGGERAQHVVDRPLAGLFGRQHLDPQHAVPDRELGAGRRDVDVIGLDRHLIGGGDDRQRGVTRQVLGQRRALASDALEDDERQTARGQPPGQRIQRIQRAGRRSDAHDRGTRSRRRILDRSGRLRIVAVRRHDSMSDSCVYPWGTSNAREAPLEIPRFPRTFKGPREAQ